MNSVNCKICANGYYRKDDGTCATCDAGNQARCNGADPNADVTECGSDSTGLRPGIPS